MVLTRNRFGSYTPPPTITIREVGGSSPGAEQLPKTECMILIVASKDFKSASILAQDQTGRSILSYPGTRRSRLTVGYSN